MAIGDADLTGTPIVAAPAPLLSGDIVTIDIGNIRIYHNGRMHPALPADNDATLAYHYGPYTALGRDSETIFNVPAHWCHAWWVDRSKAPLAIVNSPQSLCAKHWTFAYGDIGVPYGDLPTPPPYSLMGSSDNVIYEPTTGERSMIGLVTDETAKFLLTGNPDAMLTYALVGDTCPNKYLDDAADYSPIDLLNYYSANIYWKAGYQGSPWLTQGPGNADGSTGGGKWAPQGPHHPNYWHEAYRATGDLALLLQGQAHATFYFLQSALYSNQQGKAILTSEQRGVAWGLRDLFAAHAATRDAEAAGLKTGPGTPFKTAAYFQTLLDQSRTVYETIYRGDPSNQVFKLVGGNGEWAPWQQDYVIQALAFGILTGHSEWTALYLFALGNAIDRTSGKSGWPPAWSGYYQDGAQTSWANSFMAGYPGLSGAEPPSAALVAQLTADPFNAANGYAVVGTGEYMEGTRAGLAMALYLTNENILNVRATYPDLDLCYANAHRMVLKSGGVGPRHSILASLTPFTPPPATEIEMSATKLRVGETKHVTLAVTPTDADQAGLTYVAAPDGIVTLTPDLSGVAVTRTAPGVATITASLNGLTATAEADDAAPLALSLALSWDS